MMGESKFVKSRSRLSFPLRFENGSSVGISDRPISNLKGYLLNSIRSVLSLDRYTLLYRPVGPNFRNYIGGFATDVTRDLVLQDLKDYFSGVRGLSDVELVDVRSEVREGTLYLECIFLYKPTQEVLFVKDTFYVGDML